VLSGTHAGSLDTICRKETAVTPKAMESSLNRAMYTTIRKEVSQLVRSIVDVAVDSYMYSQTDLMVSIVVESTVWEESLHKQFESAVENVVGELGEG